jgi:hypothetical protein
MTILELSTVKKELQNDWGTLDYSEFEEFREALAAKVLHCFNNDMKHLMSFLYRVDVAERDVKLIMGNKEKLDVNAQQIADLIIHRCLQKGNYRNAANWQEC